MKTQITYSDKAAALIQRHNAHLKIENNRIRVYVGLREIPCPVRSYVIADDCPHVHISTFHEDGYEDDIEAAEQREDILHYLSIENFDDAGISSDYDDLLK